ncbi:Uncharacterised protein [Vibrio cholerae]|nr:Uncharacterised protein [Vibrio cholerae]
MSKKHKRNKSKTNEVIITEQELINDTYTVYEKEKNSIFKMVINKIFNFNNSVISNKQEDTERLKEISEMNGFWSKVKARFKYNNDKSLIKLISKKRTVKRKLAISSLWGLGVLLLSPLLFYVEYADHKDFNHNDVAEYHIEKEASYLSQGFSPDDLNSIKILNFQCQNFTEKTCNEVIGMHNEELNKKVNIINAERAMMKKQLTIGAPLLVVALSYFLMTVGLLRTSLFISTFTVSELLIFWFTFWKHSFLKIGLMSIYTLIFGVGVRTIYALITAIPVA